MILKKINIEQYNWRVTLLMDTDCSNNAEIIKELEKIECPDYYIYEALENLDTCKNNLGLAYSNRRLRHSVIVVGKASSHAELLNTTTHEFYHLVTHISETFDIEDDETKANLMGDLCMVVFNVIMEIISNPLIKP